MSALCSDGTSNHPVALFFHTFSGTKTGNRFRTVSSTGGLPRGLLTRNRSTLELKLRPVEFRSLLWLQPKVRVATSTLPRPSASWSGFVGSHRETDRWWRHFYIVNHTGTSGRFGRLIKQGPAAIFLLACIPMNGLRMHAFRTPFARKWRWPNESR